MIIKTGMAWIFLWMFFFTSCQNVNGQMPSQNIPMPAPHEHTNEPESARGRIIVKFKQQKESLSRTDALAVEANIETPQTVLESMSQKYHVVAVKPLIPPKPSAVGKETALMNYVYVLQVDETSDTQSLLDDLRNNPMVEYVQPDYIMTTQ